MEFINKITLQGYVGSIKVETVGEHKFATMTIITNYCYRSADGNAVLETQWTQVKVFENPKTTMTPLEDIQKNDIVRVEGRLRALRYTKENGDNVSVPEVIARSLVKIEKEEK